MRVLFWNAYQKSGNDSVLEELIIENRISLVVLAEYRGDLGILLQNLQVRGCYMTSYITIGCNRIHVIGVPMDIRPGVQSRYSSIQIINQQYVLCCVHLTSKLSSGAEEYRDIEIRQIVQDICEQERLLGTEDTIIVGDFNIDPFEAGCVDARWFHGVPIYDEAKRGQRTIAGKEFKMFYNPMWNFLGDFSGPYGTYYHNGSRSNQTYWHIYDQVLFRPGLRDRFVNQSLEILTKTSSYQLLDSKGHPNKEYSDHLPIVFEIMEGNYEQ